MRNVALDELQAGIKTDRRNINNLRYADNINLVAGREEELKNLLMRVKEESERDDLRLNIYLKRKTKIMTSSPIAAVKSLQSCPTLCDPRDGRHQAPPIPGTLQARTVEWVAISFSNA